MCFYSLPLLGVRWFGGANACGTAIPAQVNTITHTPKLYLTYTSTAGRDPAVTGNVYTSVTRSTRKLEVHHNLYVRKHAPY